MKHSLDPRLVKKVNVFEYLKSMLQKLGVFLLEPNNLLYEMPKSLPWCKSGPKCRAALYSFVKDYSGVIKSSVIWKLLPELLSQSSQHIFFLIFDIILLHKFLPQALTKSLQDVEFLVLVILEIFHDFLRFFRLLDFRFQVLLGCLLIGTLLATSCKPGL